MTDEMRERIINDARQPLDNASNAPNFADVFWSYRLFVLRRPDCERVRRLCAPVFTGFPCFIFWNPRIPGLFGERPALL